MKQLEVKDALPKGFKLHWYEIQGVLGRGGFGITYLARDTNLDVNVAIKEYFPIEYASREGHTQSLEPTTADNNNVYAWGLEKFVIEARTLAKFSHKNIVRVSSVFDQNKTAYMVMDLEAGQALSDLIANKVRFTEPQLRNMLVGLMDGLDFVHKKGFIHRDIKPANIIIRADGEPVLLDFGSARGALKQTTKLTSLVSFGYTPFEQYHASSEQQGAWTDVYALAGTFHHLILGTKPAEAMARATELMNGRRDPQLPLADYEGLGFSKGLLATIDAGLGFKVEDRPQSMAEWKAMLNQQPLPSTTKQAGGRAKPADQTMLMQGADSDSVTSYRDTKRRTASTPDRSFPWGVLVSFVVVLALGGGGYWYWQANKDALNAAVTNEPKTQTSASDVPSEAELLAEQRAQELAEIKAERERIAEELRIQKEREATRLAEEARKAEEARLAEEQRKAEEARKREAEAKRQAELQRQREAKAKAAAAREALQNQANGLIDAFIANFKARDAEALIATNQIATDKQNFIRQLLGAYQAFSLSSAPLKLDVSSQTAKTTVSITSIRAANGSIVKPGASWRDMAVVVKPNSAGELELYWQ